MIPAMKEINMEIHRFCVVCKKDFIVDNKYISNNLWCPNCLIELIKKNDPERWEMLEDWKRRLSV